MKGLVKIQKCLRGDTFVLKGYAWILVEILERLTLISLLRRFQSLKNSERFTDLWVLFNLFLSLVFWLFVSPFHVWWPIFLIYPGWRILGLVIYLLNVTLFHPYQQIKEGVGHYVRGYRRIVLLLLHNYIEVLFWYAALYRNFKCISNSNYVSIDSILGSLYFSVVTMSTLGYGEI